jgi:hypothetical protein
MSLASSGRPEFLQAEPVPEKLARDGPLFFGLHYKHLFSVRTEGAP